MQISVFNSDNQIVSEIGERLKASRIRANLTQLQLSQQSGVAKSTVERAEKGESIQLLSLIKLMRALNCLGGFETLVPRSEATPLEYVISENKKRYRVRESSKKADKPHAFKWGDEE